MASKKEKSLVIVESPTKARTITKMLGSGYKIMSSMGHVVDLPRTKFGIDIDNGFEPEYRIIKGKDKLSTQLKKEAQSSDIIYLATDPDREGEAISWHLMELLQGRFDKKRKTKSAKPVKTPVKKKKEKEHIFKRVEFHEITKKAIQEAFKNTTELNMHKVDSQQARRVLDRIVGYQLSPFLWKKVCRGLSAGRVQSVALKFIVDREREIQAFVPEKYYYVDVTFCKNGTDFTARLTRKDGEKIELRDSDAAQKIIEQISGKNFAVKTIKTSPVKRKPEAPFITSTLQQEAFRKLGYSTARTMTIAQRLYEGIELPGEDATGLITYMRTDSFNISPESAKSAREYIAGVFGKAYESETVYKFKSKGNVQAAHEAIRPTLTTRTPQELDQFLANDENSLYALIWKRFLASFMSEAEFERTQVVFTCEEYEFNLSGNRLVFDGFLKLYPEKIKEELLPELAQTDVFMSENILIEEKITQPPARFNDASLVKLLEEKSIGRPSTYAPTISTILRRDYVIREKKSFVPTELGFVVTDLLDKYFSTIIDENFTVHMENALDEVENNQKQWREVIREFYPAFEKDLKDAQDNAEKEYVSAGMVCEKCGREMVIRYSRKGRFISCIGYPECTHAVSITTNVPCPECGKGELIERKNKKGQRFYGCSAFPECRYTSSKLPQKQEDASEHRE